MNSETVIINNTINFAKDNMKNLAPSHGWDHVKRVMKISEKIARAENADLFIVKLSAVLHDIARGVGDLSSGKTCHAELGSEMANDFLLKQDLNASVIRKVVSCIKCHRYRNSHVPDTIEAKTLYDADKLDSIGAVGIGRAFLFAGEVGAMLHNSDVDISRTKPYSIDDTAYREYSVKLKHVKDKMLTQEGKRLAMARHDFMIDFFERLDLEVGGDL